MKLLVSNLHASRYLRENIANASVNSFLRGDFCIKEILQTVQGAADIVELTMPVIHLNSLSLCLQLSRWRCTAYQGPSYHACMIIRWRHNSRSSSELSNPHKYMAFRLVWHFCCSAARDTPFHCRKVLL